MSSNATDGAQPPAVSAGLQPEAGGASAVATGAASAEAAGTGAAGTGAAEIGATEPAKARTSAARKGAARTGAAATGARRTGAARTGAAGTGAARTGEADTGAARAGAARAGAARAAKGGRTKAGPAEAATGEAGAAKAGAGLAGAAEAGQSGAALAEVRLNEAPAAAEAEAADAGAMTIVLDRDVALNPSDTDDPDAVDTLDALAARTDFDELDDPDAEPASMAAFVALLTSVFALVPIAVVCAIGALIGMRRTGRQGHGMAMAALFISAAWVIIVGAVVTVGVLTHGFHKPVTIKYHEAAVFKLQVGDCVNVPNGQVVAVLPCSVPHEAEVFATFPLPASAWPGTAAVRQAASSGCASRLTGYINPQLAISLAQDYVFPDEVAWTAGTRTVICEVRATSGELTGSVRGAS